MVSQPRYWLFSGRNNIRTNSISNYLSVVQEWIQIKRRCRRQLFILIRPILLNAITTAIALSSSLEAFWWKSADYLSTDFSVTLVNASTVSGPYIGLGLELGTRARHADTAADAPMH